MNEPGLERAPYEEAHRRREPLPPNPLYDAPEQRDGGELVRALFCSADTQAVAEVVEMTTLARDSGALAELRALAGNASTRVHLGRLGPMPAGLARLIPVRLRTPSSGAALG